MKFIAIIEVIIYYTKIDVKKNCFFYFSNNIFFKEIKWRKEGQNIFAFTYP
jgi:hypothetical protein